MVMVILSHLVLESFLDNQHIWDQGIQEPSENQNVPFSQCLQSGNTCSLRWEGLEERLLFTLAGIAGSFSRKCASSYISLWG